MYVLKVVKPPSTPVPRAGSEVVRLRPSPGNDRDQQPERRTRRSGWR